MMKDLPIKMMQATGARVAAALVVLAVLLAACSSAPAPAPSGVSSSVPAPEAGKTSVVGRVMDSKTGSAMVNTPVRLAEVYRSGDSGAYVLDGGRSPGAVTNESGNFVFSNIEAREYVLVIGDLLAANVVIADSTGIAKVWTPEAGEVLDVGTLSIDLLGPGQQQGQ
jgi:hypothetical protein